ncbi:MAG: acetyl-CoA carboxylase biotin carboxyl carrier protein [Clostridia bacterium]|nr:acetyl-CoA carboxylase biotin carboxyl carrier protein [Clostridia bacterium]MBP3653380.1 acetyl-CoA carboxylase biotin carboxyl carrier protein [Clostridia bacterium]
MNIKQIKELAQIVRENGLSALEVSENESKIRIECEQKTVQAVETNVPAQQTIRIANQEPDPVDFNRTREIKSPMVGVFYAAPAPDAKPYVGVGSKVKKGDVICIVEAMKLMNEITAEFDGEVVDVCVRSGDVVEYGQPLFKLC